MEYIHSDLAGPIDPVAKESFRYSMNFVDDYSGFIFIYFLKNKSDAVAALEKFLADSAPYGTVKCLRSDNGGEYVSNSFESVLMKNKIRHEKSCPNSPHQNGTAERTWRSIFEMARCILIESKLPKQLWTYAAMASAHIRNRCYSQRTEETPYFLVKDQISVSYIFLVQDVLHTNITLRNLTIGVKREFLLAMIRTVQLTLFTMVILFQNIV